jgi:hypothetical protein
LSKQGLSLLDPAPGASQLSRLHFLAPGRERVAELLVLARVCAMEPCASLGRLYKSEFRVASRWTRWTSAAS